MIKLVLGSRTIELTPDSDGIYRVPISARYHPSIGEFQKSTNSPNFTLSTILRNLGLVPHRHAPDGDYELWRKNAPATQPQPPKDGAERFNLSGDSDTFGGKC